MRSATSTSIAAMRSAAAALVGIDAGAGCDRCLPRAGRRWPRRRRRPAVIGAHRRVLVDGLAALGCRSPGRRAPRSSFSTPASIGAHGSVRAALRDAGFRRPPGRHLPRSRPGLDQHRGARAGGQPTAAGGARIDAAMTAAIAQRPRCDCPPGAGGDRSPVDHLRVDLPVAGREVVVVGGGVVALGRIAGLRAAGAARGRVLARTGCLGGRLRRSRADHIARTSGDRCRSGRRLARLCGHRRPRAGQDVGVPGRLLRAILPDGNGIAGERTVQRAETGAVAAWCWWAAARRSRSADARRAGRHRAGRRGDRRSPGPARRAAARPARHRDHRCGKDPAR